MYWPESSVPKLSICEGVALQHLSFVLFFRSVVCMSVEPYPARGNGTCASVLASVNWTFIVLVFWATIILLQQSSSAGLC